MMNTSHGSKECKKKFLKHTVSKGKFLRSSHDDGFQNTQSLRKRRNRSHSKHRTHSSVYSNLPAANINLGAMNVYAEVRGKYSRNANNTKNAIEAPCIVSRPTTSGSLRTYTRRSFVSDEPKKEVEEQAKSNRPLNENKVAVKRRRIKDEFEKIKEENENENDEKAEKVEEGEDAKVDIENFEADKDSQEENSEDSKEEADRVTEVSFKTTSSQKRYIEELENLLKEERLKRLKAEQKLHRLSSRQSHRNP